MVWKKHREQAGMHMIKQMRLDVNNKLIWVKRIQVFLVFWELFVSFKLFPKKKLKERDTL